MVSGNLDYVKSGWSGEILLILEEAGIVLVSEEKVATWILAVERSLIHLSIEFCPLA